MCLRGFNQGACETASIITRAIIFLPENWSFLYKKPKCWQIWTIESKFGRIVTLNDRNYDLKKTNLDKYWHYNLNVS